MLRLLLTLALIAGLAALMTGCGDTGSGPAAPSSPPGTGTPPAALPGPAGPSGQTGTVVETMDAADYTYVLVDTGPARISAAGPKTPVKVGDRVRLPPGTLMTDFKSSTLNRTFKEILFVTRIAPAGAAPAAPAGASEIIARAHRKTDASAPPAKMDFSGLNKAEGGHTVAGIFAEKDRLAGQEVKVRGKVVKFNPNIMGKHWLHVQDGTGQAGSNDLTVTTGALARPVKTGDTVLVTGRLALNRDLGYGYRYAVIVEDAKVVVESR